MAGITAQYINDYTLTVSGTSIVNEAHFGRRLNCNCGVDGDKGVTVSGSSYSDPLTTINLFASDSDALTSNLVSFRYGPGVTTDVYGSVSARGLKHSMLDELDYASSGHTGFSPTSHSHVESDISDLDKYTQTEVDTISGSLSTEIDSDISTHAALGDAHHAESHTVASHSDTTATGAELNTLTDNSIADALHRHSELVASDGSPDPALSVDAGGFVGIGTDSPTYKLHIHDATESAALFTTSGTGATSTDGFYVGVLNSNLKSYVWNFENTDLIFATNNTERMTIAADGKVSLANGTGINEFSTDGTLAGDSDDAVPTEKATKTYVDSKVPTGVDHTLARYDGTTKLQDTGITVSDTDDVVLPATSSLTCQEKLVIPLNQPTSLENGCLWIA